MEFLFAHKDDPDRDGEEPAYQAFFQGVTWACASCHGENTVETKDLPADAPHHGELSTDPNRYLDHYRVSCADCGAVTNGVLPRRFWFESGATLEDITDVNEGDVVVGWGTIEAIGPSSEGHAFTVTTSSGFTFDCPEGDEVVVMPSNTDK